RIEWPQIIVMRRGAESEPCYRVAHGLAKGDHREKIALDRLDPLRFGRANLVATNAGRQVSAEAAGLNIGTEQHSAQICMRSAGINYGLVEAADAREIRFTANHGLSIVAVDANGGETLVAFEAGEHMPGKT